MVKNPFANTENTGEECLTPGLGSSLGGRNGTPLQLLLPGKSHGQRSLAGYSPWGYKEWDMTEHAQTHTIYK